MKCAGLECVGLECVGLPTLDRRKQGLRTPQSEENDMECVSLPTHISG